MALNASDARTRGAVELREEVDPLVVELATAVRV